MIERIGTRYPHSWKPAHIRILSPWSCSFWTLQQWHDSLDINMAALPQAKRAAAEVWIRADWWIDWMKSIDRMTSRWLDHIGPNFGFNFEICHIWIYIYYLLRNMCANIGTLNVHRWVDGIRKHGHRIPQSACEPWSISHASLCNHIACCPNVSIDFLDTCMYSHFFIYIALNTCVHIYIYIYRVYGNVDIYIYIK